MPKSITIRDVSDETSAELASRAAANGQSLQEYLRGRLDEIAGKPEPAVWVARVRHRLAQTESSISTEEILRYRDEGRR